MINFIKKILHKPCKKHSYLTATVIDSEHIKYDWQKALIGKEIKIHNVGIEYKGGCNNSDKGGVSGGIDPRALTNFVEIEEHICCGECDMS